MIDRSQAVRIIGEMVEIGRVFHTARQQAGAPGMTGTKFGVLAQLYHGDARIGLLAERLSVSASVATRAVQTLEEDGLVCRRTDPDDARAVLLSITPAGTEYMRVRRSAVVDLFTDRLADWSGPDAEQVLATLGRLRTDLAAVFEDLAAGRAGPAAAFDTAATAPTLTEEPA